MTGTLIMVPLARIKPGADFKPRRDFNEEQMAELGSTARRSGQASSMTRMKPPDAPSRRLSTR
jgi:hypothetical protein